MIHGLTPVRTATGNGVLCSIPRRSRAIAFTTTLNRPWVERMVGVRICWLRALFRQWPFSALTSVRPAAIRRLRLGDVRGIWWCQFSAVFVSVENDPAKPHLNKWHQIKLPTKDKCQSKCQTNLAKLCSQKRSPCLPQRPKC